MGVGSTGTVGTVRIGGTGGGTLRRRLIDRGGAGWSLLQGPGRDR